MDTQYEVVKYPDNLPVNMLFYSLESTRLHWHREMEILMVVKGSIHATVQNTTHLLREGEMLVVSPNLMHATHQSEEPNTVLVVQFNCNQFGFQSSQMDSVMFDCKGSPADHPQMAQLRQAVCALAIEMIYRHPGYEYIAASHIQTILGTLLRSFPYKKETTVESVKTKDRERIERIFSYINQNYARRITLTELAEREYLTPNHLSTLIRRTIGMCFGDYVNSVRLRAYLERLQSDTTTPLDTIAEQCGFSSSQYASALFQKAHNLTPGKYRRELQQKNAVRRNARHSTAGDAFAAVYQPSELAELLSYWREDAPEKAAKPAEYKGPTVALDAYATVGQYHRSSVSIISIGRAYEGLLSHVQQALRTAQREIGYQYLHFHGIFSDDMMILKVDHAGVLHYSWRLVDTLFDFLLSVGLRPFIELTYMPTLLASGPETVFAWRGNITPPASMEAWGELVRQLVSHCVSRYGMEEVAQWYFEAWNEPDYLDVSWSGGDVEYFKLYAESVHAIKACCPGARVCGPSVSSVGISQRRWGPAFLDYCRKNDLPVDAFSLHAYPEVFHASGLYAQMQNLNLMQRDGVTHTDTLRGPDYVQETLQLARKQTEDSPLPLIVTEWGLAFATYNPINDSAFAGTALLYSAIACDAKDVRLAHWTLSDYMEEQYSLPPQELHGGFGLMTVGGVRKPSYWAMWCLARLGPEVVRRMQGGIITRSKAGWQLLAFRHPVTDKAYDMAYARMHAQDSFLQADMQEQIWRLEGLAGTYRIKRFHFDVARCDAKTLAYAQGLTEAGDSEALAYLTEVAQPIRSESFQTVEAGQRLPIAFRLTPCSFELVTLSPVEN